MWDKSLENPLFCNKEAKLWLLLNDFERDWLQLVLHAMCVSHSECLIIDWVQCFLLDWCLLLAVVRLVWQKISLYISVKHKRRHCCVSIRSVILPPRSYNHMKRRLLTGQSGSCVLKRCPHSDTLSPAAPHCDCRKPASTGCGPSLPPCRNPPS